MIDTISNELKSSRSWDDDDDNDDDEFSFGGSSTLGLLSSRHNCRRYDMPNIFQLVYGRSVWFPHLCISTLYRYISTLTECQNIVGKEGVFGGPGKADGYTKRVSEPGFVTNPDCQSIPPPVDIGSSMERLLKKGVIFSEQQRKKFYAKSDIVRGWSLADFWENTRWPRDASGADVRFGLPTIDDDDEDVPLLSEPPPKNFERIAVGRLLRKESLSDVDDGEEAPTPVQENPHVYQISGVSGLKSEIIDQNKDSILFLSAKFCKTCKSLNPKYTRMARLEKTENAESPMFFAKTEVSSRWGKKLGAFLEVDAVPAFVLFRNGKRFGPPLSASKLPSKKIDRALKLMQSGGDWDPNILKEEKE